MKYSQLKYVFGKNSDLQGGSGSPPPPPRLKDLDKPKIINQFENINLEFPNYIPSNLQSKLMDIYLITYNKTDKYNEKYYIVSTLDKLENKLESAKPLTKFPIKLYPVKEFKYNFKKAEKINSYNEKGCNVNNIENSNYQSVVYQFLFTTPEIVNFFLYKKFNFPENSLTNAQIFILCLANLIRIYSELKNCGNGNISEIFKLNFQYFELLFADKFREFNKSEQQHLQEFLTFLIDEFIGIGLGYNKEYANQFSVNFTNSHEEEKDNNEKILKLKNEIISIQESQNMTDFRYLFGFFIKTIRICNICKKKSINIYFSNICHLQIENSQSIQECLINEKRVDESIKNKDCQYKCSNCDNCQNLTLTSELDIITNEPKIFIVHLKNESNSHIKINENNTFSLKEIFANSNIQYELFGFIVKSDTINNGKYEYYCRMTDEQGKILRRKWLLYKANNDIHKYTYEDNLIKEKIKNAYILFFKQFPTIHLNDEIKIGMSTSILFYGKYNENECIIKFNASIYEIEYYQNANIINIIPNIYNIFLYGDTVIDTIKENKTILKNKTINNILIMEKLTIPKWFTKNDDALETLYSWKADIEVNIEIDLSKISILIELVKIIQTLHANNIYHGDIKMENMGYNNTNKLCIFDFSESVKNETIKHADIFALARLSINILTNRFIFISSRFYRGFFNVENFRTISYLKFVGKILQKINFNNTNLLNEFKKLLGLNDNFESIRKEEYLEKDTKILLSHFLYILN